MQFQIITRGIKEKSIENLIIGMFEFYFSSNTNELKTSTDVLNFLQKLCDYVEGGLNKKCSANFNVLITKNPIYSVKFERGYLYGLKFRDYEILIFKAPFICINTKFTKEKIEIDEGELNKLTLNVTRLEYKNKLFNSYNYKNYSKLEKYDEAYFHKVIKRNIIYFDIKNKNKKDLTELSQAIQYDISKEEGEYK